MGADIKILYLAHKKEYVDLVVRTLKNHNVPFFLRAADSKNVFFESLKSFHPKLVLADFSFPLLRGIALLSFLREEYPDLPLIFVSETIEKEFSIEFLHQGVSDYILKEEITRLPDAVYKALDNAEKKNRLHKAELALTRSETRFRSLVETSPDWIWQVDLDWNFIYSSPRVTDLLGYAPQELEGASFFDTLREEDAKNISKKLEEYSHLENPVIKEEVANIHKKGKVVYLEARAISHRDHNGKVIGYDGVYRDISQRKEHERRLNAEAKRAKNLIELPVMAERLNELDFIHQALIVMGKQTDSYRAFLTLSTEGDRPLEVFSVQKRKDDGYWSGMEVYHCKESDWRPFLQKPGRGREGHFGSFSLDAWLTVPVREGARWIMLGGVGDASGNYSSFDQETIQLLSNEIYRLIQHHRQIKEIRENQRKINESQILALLGYWNWDFETGEYNWSELIYEVLGMEHNKPPRGYEGMREYLSRSARTALFHDLFLCRKAKKPFQRDLQVFSHKEKMRWITVRGAPILSAGRRVTGFFGTVQDISHRRRSEEHIRSLAVAMEQSSEAIVLTDTEGNIEFVNRAFLQVTGYDRREVLGKNPRILKSGNTPEEYYRTMWETLMKGEPWTGEFRNLKKDGSEFIESAKISPVKRTDGTIVQYIAVKEDITEKKKMEEDLDRYRHHLEKIVVERTEQLAAVLKDAETANLAKQSFLANMSHEIRTPMNAIMGLVHLLKRTELKVDQNEYVEKIEVSSKLLLNLINDILDLSKVESGKMKLESIPIRIPAILANVKSMLADKAAEKNLEFTIRQDPLPEKLLGDPTRITQALLNLTNNAIKFTESGFVRILALLEEETDYSSTIRFEVHDSGSGFREEDLSRMFHSFEQADSSISRKYGGSGLGLPITRHLAELMGGYADARANPDRGSVFWFSVNLLKHTEKVSRLDDISNNSPLFESMIKRKYEGARILLAEDDSINQEVAMQILKNLNLNVTIANNGREALDFLSGETDFDLVLMDMQMPVMDGLEAARQIRMMETGGKIPIIAMTANAYAEDKERCLNAGMNDYVTKPIDPDQLYRTLLKWLERDSASVLRHIMTGISEENRETVEKIKDLKGLNIAHIKQLFGNSLPLYLSLLEKYAKRYKHVTLTMDRLRKKEKFKEFYELVHKMKGAAASLGFFQIQDILRHLEEQLKKKSLSASNCLKFCELIQNHIDNIEKVTFTFDKNSPEGAERFLGDGGRKSEEISSLLQNMHDLLSSHDTAIIGLIEENNRTLTSYLGNEYNQFVNFIWDFDYPSALKLLDDNIHS